MIITRSYITSQLPVCKQPEPHLAHCIVAQLAKSSALQSTSHRTWTRFSCAFFCYDYISDNEAHRANMGPGGPHVGPLNLPIRDIISLFLYWCDLFAHMLRVASLRSISQIPQCIRQITHNFTKNSNIHVHDTRQKCHYHLPLCRTNLRKCGLRYVGASVWNNILSVNINPNVSEFIFSRSLKAAICNNLL